MVISGNTTNYRIVNIPDDFLIATLVNLIFELIGPIQDFWDRANLNMMKRNSEKAVL